MAAMGSSGWNHQDQNLQSTNEDEFHQFFEMQGMSNMDGGLNFDFQSFQDSSASGLLPHSQREQIDTSMGGTEPSLAVPTTAGISREQMAAMTTGASHPSIQAQMNRMPPTPTDTISEIDAQIQYLQQQRLQQQHRQVREQQTPYYGGGPNRIIPPTPRSLELQASNGQFFSPTDTPMFDNRVHMKDTQQDMAFTPLVSPAVTPLDPHFNVDNAFSLPPTYFSPLTSPALHAQNDPNAYFNQQLQQGVVNTNSPVEMELETNHNAPQEVTKKARKASTSKATRKTNVRQSPITKPQRRKTASTSIVNQVLNEAVETSSKSRTSSPNVTGMRRDDIDENSSVSPENLSEMPPPPLPPPKVTKGKQASNGKESSSASKPAALPLAAMPSPATPASLMKLPSSSPSSSATSANALKPTASPNGNGAQAPTESVDTMFQLPESVTNLPDEQHFTPLDAPAQSHPTTGEPASGKTPSMPPMPSPAFGKSPGTTSASQSPMLGPGASTPTAKRTPQLAPRGSKKRQGSVTASPALLPRISPNIKPLLPGPGGEDTSEDAASRLLTTKSNYQNILEGNKVPGVSYPSELSTNLSSKRTSHKIAEQGRRNRINSALQEIAALLPAPPKDVKGSPEAEAKVGTPGSKASTVEMAIEYIKQLREEVEVARRRAEAAEEKLRAKDGEKTVEEEEEEKKKEKEKEQEKKGAVVVVSNGD